MRLETGLLKLRETYIQVGATIGLIVAGLPPAIIFGNSLIRALIDDSYDPVASRLAGISLAVVFEVIGATSAHVTQLAKNPKTRRNGYLVLGTYTAMGSGWMIFFEPDQIIKTVGILGYMVAPLLYYGVALLSNTARAHLQAQEAELIEQKLDVRKKLTDLEQEKLDREHKREMSRLRAQHKHDERVQKVSGNFPETFQEQESTQETFQSDWRKLSIDQKLSVSKLSRDELERTFGVSARTALNWHRRSTLLHGIIVFLSENPFKIKDLSREFPDYKESEIAAALGNLQDDGVIRLGKFENAIVEEGYV